MTRDIISMMQRAPTTGMLQMDRLFDPLFDPIIIGDHLLDIQASKNHHCWPEINNLPAYMYDSFEVLVYGPEIPPTIMHDMKGIKFDKEIQLFSYMPARKLQLLYDELEMYYNTHFFSVIDPMLHASEVEYMNEIQKQCELTHQLTSEPLWQRIAMRRMLTMMYGVK